MFEVFSDVKKGKYERNMVTNTEEPVTKGALERVAGPLEIKGEVDESMVKKNDVPVLLRKRALCNPFYGLIINQYL